jgi:hypothetical protein
LDRYLQILSDANCKSPEATQWFLGPSSLLQLPLMIGEKKLFVAANSKVQSSCEGAMAPRLLFTKLGLQRGTMWCEQFTN